DLHHIPSLAIDHSGRLRRRYSFRLDGNRVHDIRQQGEPQSVEELLEQR
ncbi:unnamed protein product, partial [Allacma fusca]